MFSFARPHRRWNPRHLYRGKCQAVRLDRFDLVGERILDLSERGALLACDDEVKEGDELLVSFQTPWLGPWVDATALVTRVVGGWREGDPGYAAGLHFLGLEPGVQRDLARRIELLPTKRPARRHPRDYAETVRRIGLGRPSRRR
ncbi:MAG: PilZ domain-containing protein [Sandaracinaceae bacterium]